MQTQVQKLLAILVLLTVLMGCSRKKDKFLSRNFHAITAEYNTLFNGRQAFEQGRDALIESYQETLGFLFQDFPNLILVWIMFH